MVNPQPLPTHDDALLDFHELLRKFKAMQEKQLEYREKLQQARYRDTMEESSRVGRKLIEAISKRKE